MRSAGAWRARKRARLKLCEMRVMVWGFEGGGLVGEGGAEGGEERERKSRRGKKRFWKESVAKGSVLIRSLALGEEG